MRKLISNTTTAKDADDAKRKVRISNPNKHIQAAVNDMNGALDLMFAVGFMMSESEDVDEACGGGDPETYLVFPPGDIPAWLPSALERMEQYESGLWKGSLSDARSSKIHSDAVSLDQLKLTRSMNLDESDLSWDKYITGWYVLGILSFSQVVGDNKKNCSQIQTNVGSISKHAQFEIRLGFIHSGMLMCLFYTLWSNFFRDVFL